jgi:lysophospholipase L1-like esterase
MVQRRRAPLGRRLLLSLAAMAFALLAAEVAFRALATYPGTFRMDDGREVPLSEVVAYLRGIGEAAVRGPGPHGALPPGARFRMCYSRPRRDFFDADGCVQVAFNSLGFRDDEFPVQKPRGEFRAIALGDSFTFGLGLPAEMTWPQVLERMLQRERADPVQVINGGFAADAHSPDGYQVWMREQGLGFEPDLVLIGFCLNDMGSYVPLLFGVAPLEPVLGGFSRLLDHAVRAYRQRQLDTTEVRRHLATLRREEADRHPAWRASRQGLRELKAVLDARGVLLVVAVLPMLTELKDYPFARLHELVMEFCRENGIRAVDLQGPFLGLRDEDLWLHPTDQHPNHIGHRMIAEGVFAYLKGEGLVR